LIIGIVAVILIGKDSRFPSPTNVTEMLRYCFGTRAFFVSIPIVEKRGKIRSQNVSRAQRSRDIEENRKLTAPQTNFETITPKLKAAA